MKRILILTSHTGGGHLSLAEALRGFLEPDYEIEVVDPLSNFFQSHYQFVSRHALWLWAAEFKLMDTPGRALTAHKVHTRFAVRSLTEMVEEHRPDLIISTYAFLTYEVMRVLEKLDRFIPFIMLFSDPNGVHEAWLTEKGAAATFATSEENYRQAKHSGFAPERLHLTGWPVRKQFREIPAGVREDVLGELGLDPHRFTVFLQGGGEGAARFAETVENAIAVSDLQIILAAGTNEKLQRQFAGREQVGVIPFTPRIAPYMAAADLVMGKAGPNMLFETVTLAKPFIATTFIPGQEEVNLEFIERHRLGWVALEPARQRELLMCLRDRPEALSRMQQTVAAYQEWNASANARITQVTRELLES